MPAERKTPPPCPHEQEFGENTIWPDDVSLEHFDKCLTPDGRLWVWEHARKMADTGSRCIMVNHDGRVASLQASLENNLEMTHQLSLLRQVMRTDQAYISALTEQLREMARDLEGPHLVDQAEAAARVRAILGTRTESVEQVEP